MKKQPRQHERDRASSWRDANSTGESKTDEKKFLTPSQKKKIAFINGDIHSDADSVHAYIVFAHPPPHSRPANLPPLPPVMNPFEAARLAVEKCNGTTFLDRMLRVDTVVKRSTLESPSDSTLPSSAIGDPKLSIFVGNLDFASKEEDLRVYFEGIVSAERGPSDVDGLQDSEKAPCWVTRVRMIRDKDTQLGKGFAYVQFLVRALLEWKRNIEKEPFRIGLVSMKFSHSNQENSNLPNENYASNDVNRFRMPLLGRMFPPPNLHRHLLALPYHLFQKATHLLVRNWSS